jgi:hypothetical protein
LARPWGRFIVTVGIVLRKKVRGGHLKMDSEVVKVRVAGIFGGSPTNEVAEEQLQEGDTPYTMLKRLDKRKVFGRKFFSVLMKRDSAIFLLNGDRLGPPELKCQKLAAGDELSVLSAIAGG